MQRPTLPDITDADRQAAFERFALHSKSHANLTAALQDPIAARVITIMALKARTDAWKAGHQRQVVPLHRCKPGVDGHPVKWATQLVYGDWAPNAQPDLQTPSA